MEQYIKFYTATLIHTYNLNRTTYWVTWSTPSYIFYINFIEFKVNIKIKIKIIHYFYQQED